MNTLDAIFLFEDMAILLALCIEAWERRHDHKYYFDPVLSVAVL